MAERPDDVPDDVINQVRWLAQRVARIETLLQMPRAEESADPAAAALPPSAPTSSSPPSPGQPPAIGAAPAAPLVAPAPAAPPLAPPALAARSILPIRRAPNVPPSAPPVGTPVAPPVASPPPLAPPAPASTSPPFVPPFMSAAPPPIAAPPAPRRSFEALVGGKWMAWVGALAVVAGVGYFLKLGYDEGWWSKVPPAMRCLSGAGLGLLLLGAGEWALRRIGRGAALGLLGAGLSILYLVAWAAFGFFDPPLIGRGAAFVLMGLVAVTGFAATVRTRFLAIGILSMIGGYATPLLLRGGATHTLEFLAFITMLLGIALGLSASRRRSFRSLRYVALGLHSFVALAWVVNDHGAHWLMAMTFFTMWWGMLVVECTFAAMRRQSSIGNVVATLLATAGYVTACTWLLGWAAGAGGFDWRGVFTAAIAVIGGAIALQFGPGPDALRGQLRTAMARLSVALYAQCAVLLMVAAAIQFDGFGESVAWLAIGVASIELARRLPSRGVGVFGLIILLLASAKVVAIDWWLMRGLRTPLVQWGSINLTAWGGLGLLAIAALHASAQRLGAPGGPAFRPWRIVAPALAAIGTAGWLLLAMTELSGLASTSAWLAAVVVLCITRRVAAPQRHFEIGLIVLAATATRWVLVDAAMARESAAWIASLPVFNAQTLLATAIVAVGAWTERLMRGPQEGPALTARGQVVFILGVFFMLLACSFEVDRALTRYDLAAPWSPFQARLLWWTGLWSLGAIFMWFVGETRRLPKIGATGWGLAALAAMAWLGADTITWRLFEGLVPATPVLNLQFAVGLITAAAVVMGARLASWVKHADPAGAPGATGALAARLPIAGVLLALIGLWMGSLEIDRALGGDVTAVQTGLSVYWCLYAVALVVLGFARRIAPARYAGLALLGITGLKVVAIDMSHVDQVWRVVSLMVLGALMLVTGVIYSRLAPRFLGVEPVPKV